jgi:hypothetical protein
MNMMNKDKPNSKEMTIIRGAKITHVIRVKGKSQSFNRQESDIFYSNSKNKSLTLEKSFSPRQNKIIGTMNKTNLCNKQMMFLQYKLNNINNKITKANVDSINLKSNFKILKEKITNKLKEKEIKNKLHSIESTPLLLIRKYNDETFLPTINTHENVNKFSFWPGNKSEKKIKISRPKLIKKTLNLTKDDNIAFNNEEIIKCLKRENKVLMSIH